MNNNDSDHARNAQGRSAAPPRDTPNPSHGSSHRRGAQLLEEDLEKFPSHRLPAGSPSIPAGRGTALEADPEILLQQWRKAMKTEMEAHDRNGTWILVGRPEDRSSK